MRNHYVKANLILSLALALAPIGAVAALEDEIDPCPEGEVSGTVVAVETGMVTIKTGAGLCTVALGGDFDHPIVALLDAFFGEVSAENLAAALDATSVWVDCNADPCTLASEGDVGADPATVLSVTDNGDGTFTLELSVLSVEGVASLVMVTTGDPALADDLSQALETLTVEWTGEAG